MVMHSFVVDQSMQTDVWIEMWMQCWMLWVWGEEMSWMREVAPFDALVQKKPTVGGSGDGRVD